jgi:hypothetical protein
MKLSGKAKTGEPESDRKHCVLGLLGLTGGCVSKILGPFDAGGARRAELDLRTVSIEP